MEAKNTLKALELPEGTDVKGAEARDAIMARPEDADGVKDVDDVVQALLADLGESANACAKMAASPTAIDAGEPSSNLGRMKPKHLGARPRRGRIGTLNKLL